MNRSRTTLLSLPGHGHVFNGPYASARDVAPARCRIRALLLGAGLLFATTLGAPAPAHAITPGQACEQAASEQLRSCVSRISQLERRCHQQTGASCASADPRIGAVFSRLESTVLGRCPDQATVTAAGYGAALTPAGLVARLEEACTEASDGLLARSFGGPHAAVRNAAGDADRTCLDRAQTTGASVLASTLRQYNSCLRTVHRGGSCDTARLAARLAQLETRAATQIATRCPSALETLVAIDSVTLVERTSSAARCLVAKSHGQTAPLTLDCGPRAAVPPVARATPTQIVLDSDTWGTRCGNGSPYAFWVWLPPAGTPVENVVVYLQGGGACYDGPSCAGQPATRFDALAETPPGNGIMSVSKPENPFRDWTKIFLPYCTQDVHLGGGVTNVYPEITVQRYGAVNVRTALRYVRDLLWTELDASDAEGYRGDRVRAVISGGSAGGYGTVFNYHWMLDDLRWPHTTAAPDSGLGMDNGQADGVIAIGTQGLLAEPPGWNTRPFLPPYCFTPGCSEIFDNLELATSPRLKLTPAWPEQQILNISNQIDLVQRNTTSFPSTAAFVNTLRANYCNTQGMIGLHAFFTGRTETQHTQVTSDWFFDAVIDGTSMAQWLSSAMAAPDAVADRIDPGTLEQDYAGVQPFPCTLEAP